MGTTEQLQAKITAQTNEILKLRRTLEDKEHWILKLQSIVDELRTEIERLRNELLDSDAKLAMLRRDRKSESELTETAVGEWQEKGG